MAPPLTTASEPQDSACPATGEPSTGRGASVSPVPLQALAVWIAATVAMTLRVLSWKPSQTPDAWAYLAWGQALLRAERPLYNHALTTPKPLGMLLGMIAGPLPPERGFQLVVIVLLGAMAAALYWVAFNTAGTVGAAVALACLGTSAVIGQSLQKSLIDGAAAALVMLAIATSGRRRLLCLILAGLARPEAWLLTGVAAYSQASGSPRRRLALGLLGAALAPLIWSTADLLLAGNAFASSDRANTIVKTMRLSPPALSTSPGQIASATATDIGAAAAAAGLAGILLLVIRGHRKSGVVDPLVVAVLIGWPAAALVEMRFVPFEARYLFAAMAPLLVGCAVVGGVILRKPRLGGAWFASVCASIAFALALSLGSGGPAVPRQTTNGLPVIERALGCGHLEVYGRAVGDQTGTRQAARLVPALAALSHHSLHDFVIGPTPGHLSALLWIGGRRPPRPGWVVTQIPPGALGGLTRLLFPSGSLAVTPACAARG